MKAKIFLLLLLSLANNNSVISVISSDFPVVDHVGPKEIRLLREIFEKEDIKNSQERMDALSNIFNDMPNEKNSPKVAQMLVMSMYTENHGFILGPTYELILISLMRNINSENFNPKLLEAVVSSLSMLEKTLGHAHSNFPDIHIKDRFIRLIVQLKLKENTLFFSTDYQNKLIKILISKITDKSLSLFSSIYDETINLFNSKIKEVSKFPTITWSFLSKEKQARFCELQAKKVALLDLFGSRKITLPFYFFKKVTDNL